MLTNSHFNTAQRAIRKPMPKRSSYVDRIAHHRVQLARVRESVARIPDQARERG